VKRIVFLAFSLVLLSVAVIGRFAGPVEVGGTIYIRPNGSVSPSTAKITTVDNVTYTFTDDNPHSIIVQRDSIMIDGAGYTLRGRQDWSSKGIDLTGRRNVTITNMKIREFFFGVWLEMSSGNSISGNDITENKVGIWLSESSDNIVSGNGITANMDYNIYLRHSSNNAISGNSIAAEGRVWEANLHYSFFGIYLYHSPSNSISENNITNNGCGIELFSSSNDNNISGNEIASNTCGIWLWRSSSNNIHRNNMTDNDQGIVFIDSSSNIIYHDNLVNNTEQVHSCNSTNVWDDGYPSGGNYWSDYEDRYPDAKEMGGSGIWDTVYEPDENNQDRYPLMKPWTPEVEAPAQAEEESLIWMQWWLWLTVAVGIVVLGGVYLLKKRRTHNIYSEGYEKTSNVFRGTEHVSTHAHPVLHGFRFFVSQFPGHLNKSSGSSVSFDTLTGQFSLCRSSVRTRNQIDLQTIRIGIRRKLHDTQLCDLKRKCKLCSHPGMRVPSRCNIQDSTEFSPY